ncbi:MAG: TIGR00730 family Rossman fold protein [Saprospiraceae bacterium]
MNDLHAIAVFCGSSAGNDPVYREAAQDLAYQMVKKDIRLVYGGGNIGLMGTMADTMLATGGEVYGVIPAFLKEKEVAHNQLTQLFIVDTMHTRKYKIFDLCDGVIALPGGFGTLDELFEMITWAQLGLHQFPIALLNTKGYYDHLIKQIDHMVSEGFIKPIFRTMLLIESDPGKLLQAMAAYEAPGAEKWIRPDQA